MNERLEELMALRRLLMQTNQLLSEAEFHERWRFRYEPGQARVQRLRDLVDADIYQELSKTWAKL